MEPVTPKYKRYPRKKKKQLQRSLAGRIIMKINTSNVIFMSPFDRDWSEVLNFIK